MRTRIVALGGPLAFTVCWVVLGILTPGYSPKSEYISALAAQDGRYPWIMEAGFVLLAASLAAIAITVGRSGAAGASRALWVAGVAAVGATLARETCSTALMNCYERVDRQPLVSATHLHNGATTLLFVSMSAAALLLTWRRVQDSAPPIEIGLYLVLGTVCLAVAAIWFAWGEGVWGGLLERTFASVLIVWLTAAVGQLREPVIELPAVSDLSGRRAQPHSVEPSEPRSARLLRRTSD